MPDFRAQIKTNGIPIAGLTAEGGTTFPTTVWEGREFHRSDLKQKFIYLNGGWHRMDSQGYVLTTDMNTALNLKANLNSPTFTGTVGGITKAMVGLSNVDNTADSAKPVSTAQQTALNAKEGTIAAGTTAQYWRGDKTWQTLNKAAVGLSNVDNTADSAKPVSTAQQTALNAKADNVRQILAGTGLTGGGNLTADRTLAVAFGSGANQVMMGNTPLNSIPTATGNVGVGGYEILNLALTPSQPHSAASKSYVDSVAAGLDVKDSVRWLVSSSQTMGATTPVGASIWTTANFTQPDGASAGNIAEGDRVLFIGEADPRANGVWIRGAQSSASGSLETYWTRATDSLSPGSFYFVEKGESYGDTGWVVSSDSSITVGTTAITFKQFSASADILAGNGLTKTGNVIGLFVDENIFTFSNFGDANDGKLTLLGNSVKAVHMDASAVSLAGNVVTGTLPISKGGTGATTVAAARTALGVVGVYEGTVPAGAAGAWVTVTHNLASGNYHPRITVMDATSKEAVELDTKWVSTNSVAVRSDLAIAANQYTIQIGG